jgi:hypothetical protein
MKKRSGAFISLAVAVVMVLGLSVNVAAAPKAADGKTLQFGISLLGEQPEDGKTQYNAKDYLHLNTSFNYDCKLTVCEEVHNTEIGSSYSNDTILSRIEGYIPTLKDFVENPAKGEKGLGKRDIYLENQETFFEEYYIRWYVLKYSGGKWKIDGVVEKKPVVEEPVVEEPVVEEPVVEEPVVEEPVVEEPVVEEVENETVIVENKEEVVAKEVAEVAEVPATEATVAANEEAPVEVTSVFGASFVNPDLAENKEEIVEVAEIKENETAVLGASFSKVAKTADNTPILVTVASLLAMTGIMIILFAKRRKEEENN